MNSMTVADVDMYADFKAEAEAHGITGADGLVEFGKLFAATAANFVRMAFWLRYAEEKGADLTATKKHVNGFYVSLHRLAYGKLRADLLVRYCDKITVLKRLGALSLQEQDAIMENGGVKLLVYGVDGTPSHIIADPGEMTKDQIDQAFDVDHIRSESEQALKLAEWRKRQIAPLPSELYGWKIDPELGIAKKGHVVVKLEELEEIVKILRKGRRVP